MPSKRCVFYLNFFSMQPNFYFSSIGFLSLLRGSLRLRGSFYICCPEFVKVLIF